MSDSVNNDAPKTGSDNVETVPKYRQPTKIRNTKLPRPERLTLTDSSLLRKCQHGAVTFETGRATDVEPSRVETREDFARFLVAVLADFRATGASEWENGTLDRFLDAFAAFADTRVVDVPEQDQEHASWRLFAGMVQAATGYE